MGILVRAAVVVGAIYALSPVRDTTLDRRSARDLVQAPLERLGGAALDRCVIDPAPCQAVAGPLAGAAAVAAATLAATPKRSQDPPPPKPRDPARPARSGG